MGVAVGNRCLDWSGLVLLVEGGQHMLTEYYSEQREHCFFRPRLSYSAAYRSQFVDAAFQGKMIHSPHSQSVKTML